MKKFLLSLCVMMLTCLGTWAQYGITYNGTSATITEESPGQSLEVIISDINTNHSDVVNFSLPSSWTKEQVNTFAQGVTNKKSISKDTYGTVDVWSYIDPKTSASTNYSGTVYAGSEIGKPGENYGKLNSYSVVPTAENISYVKSGTTDVYTVSATTPVLYQGGNEYGVEEGNLIELYVAYMNGSEKYTGTLMALEGGNAYGNTGNAIEVTTANVPYTYNTGGFDYVYLSGDVYTTATNNYYLPNADDIKTLTANVVWHSYGVTGPVVDINEYTLVSGPHIADSGDTYYIYDGEWSNGIWMYPVSTYKIGEEIYTGTVYTKDDVKYGYIGSDAHELTAVNSSLTYETSTNKVYTGRLYKDASDNTVGGDGADIALTTERFSDEACTVVYTGPATEDNSKGGTDPFLLSKSYTYTYTDLTGTEHTSDPFASKQTQINLSGDELYIEVANNPIPAKTSSELIVYTTAEGELQALIEAMTPEEKAAVKTIAINGVISYADATSLSNLTSAKVFDVTNATGSLGSIDVSGVVVASDAAAITTRNNLTAVVTPVDATTVDVVKGSASTIDAEALEVALAGKQIVNIKNPDVNSTIVNTSLIDKLPSNITKVSVADNSFGDSQKNIAVSNTNITEFDASNIRGAYGKLTLDLSASTGLTTVNLVNSLLPEDQNVIGTLTLPNKPLTIMCTAAEKARVKALIGDDSNITYVVPAVKLAVSIAEGLSVNHDKTIELSVIESAITVEAAGYDALVKGEDYSLVVKQNGTAVTAAGLDASTFDTDCPNVTSIPFTVEVTSLNSELYTDADVANGSIALTHKKSFTLALSFADDKTEISANSSETAQINATSKDGETDVNVTYTYKSSDESVATVNTTTGLVTAVRGSSEPVTITVTATPTGEDADKYAPMTETISIEVTQSWVTLSKETIDGKEYVVVNVPVGGAFGPINDDPTTWKSAAENPATLADLKIAANVKVTGYLANSDVQELVNLLGACDNVAADVEALNCKVLDMGGAQMTEAITFTDANGRYKCSLVSATNQKSLVSVEELTLPRPAGTGVENGTVLPKGMAGLTAGWYTDNVSKLQSLTIPDGWTEIADEAWNKYGAAGVGEGTALEKVTSIKLPESLLRIGRASLAGSSVKTLFIPSKVTYIGDEAFNSAQHLQDVYFTGPAPRYVHVNAFAAENQMVNNTVDDNDFNGQLDPAADRSRYTVNGILACIMHYPEEYKSQYVDETRIYKRQDPTILYDKGNATPENQTSYIPNEKWTADFIKYLNDLREAENHDATYLAVQYVDCGFKDVTLGYSYTWPSQGQMTTGYTFAHFGYKWSGDPMDEDTQYNPEATPENELVDRRGLYQFINTMGNAPESQEEWTFDFENDKWYTLCVPFNMTVADIRKVFGPDTQVCRFSKVVRTVDVDEEAGTGVKKIYLEFRKDVMEPNGYASADNVPYLQEHASDGGGLVTVYATSATTGIVHHVPYMIKPSGTVDNQSVKFDEETGARWFVYAGYEALNGSYYHDKVTSEGGSAKVYDFQGVTLKRSITKNSYVLSAKGENSKHIFGFYKGALNTTTGKYEDGGTWNAYTATVVPEDGDNEYDTFFKDIDPTIAHAPVYTFYIDDEEPTGIEAYEIVCGNDPITDGKIYTVSGQRVNGINLTPGIYIKNGKKFIVK